MAVQRKLPIALSIALAGLAFIAPTALAQKAAGKQAAASEASAPPPLRNSWICLAGMQLEVMPVSHDVSDAPEEWVLVYKQNGNPISAQKISATEARNTPSFDCSAESRIRGATTLVG